MYLIFPGPLNLGPSPVKSVIMPRTIYTAQFWKVIRILKHRNMKKNLFTSLFLAVIILLSCKKKEGTSPSNTPVEITSSVLVESLTLPWEILWGPDNQIWMTERGGKISRVNPATGDVVPLLIISEVDSKGEGGLLGMVLHPQFNSKPYVFVTYNYTSASSYREKVVRYTFSSGKLADPLIIQDNISGGNIHNGSRLVIVDDKIFISTGDAGNSALPQDNGFINGKILRLNLDGTIPSDNPFSGNAIWSKGHRNPQGLVYANNILYSSEHGPDTDDEINIIEKGRNYGWPTVRGFCNEGGEVGFCSANNVKEPIKAWTPTIAVSGMDYYNNNLIPQWKNSLLVATLKNSRLMQLKLDDTHKVVTETNEFFSGMYGRMRDICIGPDGKVYICTSNGSNDKIVVVTKKN